MHHDLDLAEIVAEKNVAYVRLTALSNRICHFLQIGTKIDASHHKHEIIQLLQKFEIVEADQFDELMKTIETNFQAEKKNLDGT